MQQHCAGTLLLLELELAHNSVAEEYTPCTPLQAVATVVLNAIASKRNLDVYTKRQTMDLITI